MRKTALTCYLSHFDFDISKRIFFVVPLHMSLCLCLWLCFACDSLVCARLFLISDCCLWIEENIVFKLTPSHSAPIHRVEEREKSVRQRHRHRWYHFCAFYVYVCECVCMSFAVFTIDEKENADSNKLFHTVSQVFSWNWSVLMFKGSKLNSIHNSIVPFDLLSSIFYQKRLKLSQGMYPTHSFR